MSEQRIRVIDLLRDVDVAVDRMSNKNSHKPLFKQCQAAIIELAQLAHGRKPEHLVSPEQAEANGL